MSYEAPVMYLQTDNCGKNTNKTMFAFLTDLVRKKVFNKIKACFLMVEHMHEEKDQVFATIYAHLRQVHIVCLDQPSLFQAICNAFAQEHKPQISQLLTCKLVDWTSFYKHKLTQR